MTNTHSHPSSATADVLQAHPWIARADIADDSLRLIVAEDALSTVRRADGEAQLGGLSREHLAHWAEVYDWTYTSSTGPDGDADLAGWRATDTGAPLPAEHMAEWVDRTIELVLTQCPQHVLELGCGTGLLTRRLLPHVSSYIGTDVAREVVDRLTAENLDGAQFVQAAAHELRGDRVRAAIAQAGATPDCILLNSVTQCFGDYSYLTAVVLDALDAVAPGGTVIIGDIRDSARLMDFAKWAEHAADPSIADDVLQSRALARAAADTEMCLDPTTLAGLAQASGRAVSVLAHAKTLTMDSELTRYRFDAVLTQSDIPVPEADRIAWNDLVADCSDDSAALEALRVRLAAGPIIVTGIGGQVTGAALHEVAATAGAAVLVDATDPTALTVASPPAAGSVVCSTDSRVHEPLGAFARSRVAEVARRLLRRADMPLPERVDVVLPSGRAMAAPAGQQWCDRVDHAGRVAVSGDATPITDAALARVPRAVERLDSIALASLCAFVRSAGVEAGSKASIAHLLAELRVAERHEWIVRRWIRVLCDEQLAHRVSDDCFILDVDGSADPTPDERDLARACRALGYPSQMVTFYSTAISALGPLLRDELSAQALLFPDGDMATSLSKDENNLSNRYLHGCVAAVLAETARTHPGPLRIVELGGGAGGGTAAALAALPEEGVDYLFTDISRFFTDAAVDRFAHRRGFRTAVVDIDRPLTDQGIAPGSVDVVVAANVLHCAHNVDRSIAEFSSVLTPSGTAVIVEAVREHYLVLLTMQFLLSGRDGAQHPGTGDARANTGSVFSSAIDLRTGLAAAGLRCVLELPRADTPLAAPHQQLFVSNYYPS